MAKAHGREPPWANPGKKGEEVNQNRISYFEFLSRAMHRINASLAVGLNWHRLNGTDGVAGKPPTSWGQLGWDSFFWARASLEPVMHQPAGALLCRPVSLGPR